MKYSTAAVDVGPKQFIYKLKQRLGSWNDIYMPWSYSLQQRSRLKTPLLLMLQTFLRLSGHLLSSSSLKYWQLLLEDTDLDKMMSTLQCNVVKENTTIVCVLVDTSAPCSTSCRTRPARTSALTIHGLLSGRCCYTQKQRNNYFCHQIGIYNIKPWTRGM